MANMPTPEQLETWRHLQWANAVIMSRFRRDLAEFDLTIEEFDVLVHLAWAPSSSLPLHELTESMVTGSALSRSGITRLLDRMERDELVRRDLNRGDRRRFDVTLTRKGRARYDEVWLPHEDGIQEYFVTPLSKRDIADLSRILAKLIDANEQNI
jgi:DNA-binding MarR family transcriptional regulator